MASVFLRIATTPPFCSAGSVITEYDPFLNMTRQVQLMSIDDLIDKYAAEMVEEILSCPEGTAWFVIVRSKLAALARELKERRKK